MSNFSWSSVPLWLRPNPDRLTAALSAAAFIWGFLPDDPSYAASIHQGFRTLIREEGLRDRIWFAAGLAFWPVTFLALSALATATNGAAVARRSGKSVLRQLREQFELATTKAVLPPWYYIFELFDDERREQVLAYLHRFETKGAIFRVLRRYNPVVLQGGPRTAPILKNKAAFPAWCRAHGLAAAPVLFLFEPDRIVRDGTGDPIDAAEVRLPATDLFIKPKRGTGGEGATRWAYIGEGRYRGIDGTVLNEAELIAHLQAVARQRALLVEPRIVNHPEIADLSTGALTTVRIVTCRNEQGGFEATNAVFKMARGRDSVVDNWSHAGGIAAKVELATGMLGRATDMGLRPGTGWLDRHPDTGAPILGRRLPCWTEALDLARRAHAAFPDLVVIGWDMGLAPDGPVLIEGNRAPDLDLMQRVAAEPLGNARLGELIAFHLKEALRLKRLGKPCAEPA